MCWDNVLHVFAFACKDFKLLWCLLLWFLSFIVMMLWHYLTCACCIVIWWDSLLKEDCCAFLCLSWLIDKVVNVFIIFISCQNLFQSFLFMFYLILFYYCAHSFLLNLHVLQSHHVLCFVVFVLLTRVDLRKSFSKWL